MAARRNLFFDRSNPQSFSIHWEQSCRGLGKAALPGSFLSKLTDSDGELQESIHWLDTANACEYLSADEHAKLLQAAETLGRMLGGIMAKHETFSLR